ncbi:PilZ domain-containing protein [Paludibaculum fermentans]|uniref:PilZ domain-containing protein n=1 Tax=Paludibaculum fermentans TaxID=1473598 RepID=UPI003EBFDF57
MPLECSAYTDDELEGYLLGRSPEDLAERIAAHCRVCPDCQAQLAELEQFILKLKVALERVESEGTVDDWFDATDSERVESRSAHRLPCNTPVSVRYLDDTGAGQLSRGYLVDRSVDGAALILLDPLAVGDKVSIAFSKRSIDATVKYCQANAGGFRIGLKFTQEPAPSSS